jgi:hypothetical protein
MRPRCSSIHPVDAAVGHRVEEAPVVPRVLAVVEVGPPDGDDALAQHLLAAVAGESAGDARRHRAPRVQAHRGLLPGTSSTIDLGEVEPDVVPAPADLDTHPQALGVVVVDERVGPFGAPPEVLADTEPSRLREVSDDEAVSPVEPETAPRPLAEAMEPVLRRPPPARIRPRGDVHGRRLAGPAQPADGDGPVLGLSRLDPVAVAREQRVLELHRARIRELVDRRVLAVGVAQQLAVALAVP